MDSIVVLSALVPRVEVVLIEPQIIFKGKFFQLPRCTSESREVSTWIFFYIRIFVCVYTNT